MPKAEQPPAYDSFDILRPFLGAIQYDGDVQIMGGLGTVALEDPRVEISTQFREVYAPPDLALPSRRPNGTKRDVDVLVASSDPVRRAEVDALLSEAVGRYLVPEVFGIHSHERLTERVDHPFGVKALLTVLSDRYEDSPSATGRFVKALPPFSVPIAPESLETWRLITSRGTVPIPHPAITLANYSNRSAGGLRPKDAAKMNRAAANIFEKAPELREWLIDGPGRSQLELGKLIASLNYSIFDERDQVPLVADLEATPYSTAELIEHDAFLYRDAPDVDKMAIIALARFKSRVVHFGDAYIADWWQTHMEHRVASIIKNEK